MLHLKCGKPFGNIKSLHVLDKKRKKRNFVSFSVPGQTPGRLCDLTDHQSVSFSLLAERLEQLPAADGQTRKRKGRSHCCHPSASSDPPPCLTSLPLCLLSRFPPSAFYLSSLIRFHSHKADDRQRIFPPTLPPTQFLITDLLEEGLISVRQLSALPEALFHVSTSTF